MFQTSDVNELKSRTQVCINKLHRYTKSTFKPFADKKLPNCSNLRKTSS